jgi:hypothetical protein
MSVRPPGPRKVIAFVGTGEAPWWGSRAAAPDGPVSLVDPLAAASAGAKPTKSVEAAVTLRPRSPRRRSASRREMIPSAWSMAISSARYRWNSVIAAPPQVACHGYAGARRAVLEPVSERSTVPPGRAGRRDAASSAAPVSGLIWALPASLPRTDHRTPATSHRSETSSERHRARRRRPRPGLWEYRSAFADVPDVGRTVSCEHLHAEARDE